MFCKNKWQWSETNSGANSVIEQFQAVLNNEQQNRRIGLNAYIKLYERGESGVELLGEAATKSLERRNATTAKMLNKVSYKNLLAGTFGARCSTH
ncbi:unnamed protein product [Gongylonema pulchrum]|uniref:Ribonucleoside-diphosphate reductase n=1 Tax=Gongylonema pulchrum TaxID=637853 RepID=A0A183ELX0_9BILA|nr:unnamed protein product [Gongylonema pulchrum]